MDPDRESRSISQACPCQPNPALPDFPEQMNRYEGRERQIEYEQGFGDDLAGEGSIEISDGSGVVRRELNRGIPPTDLGSVQFHLLSGPGHRQP